MASHPDTRDASLDCDLLPPLLDSVTSNLHLLDAFNQRNKNQHRVAAWWAQLGILRRPLKRLAQAIHARNDHDHQRRHRPRNNPPPSSSRKTPSAAAVKEAKVAQELQEVILAHARWLNDQVLPEAYLAFTQLAADQQHAPLGLFLIGIVANLRTSLASVLPPSSAPPSPEPAAFAHPVLATGPEDHHQHDLGIAVLRPEATEEKLQRLPTSHSHLDEDDDHDVHSNEVSSSSGGSPTRPTNNQKKNTTTATTSTASKPSSRKPEAVPDVDAKSKISGPESDPPTKKTKSKIKTKQLKTRSKRKGGDEFADLFGSLL